MNNIVENDFFWISQGTVATSDRQGVKYKTFSSDWRFVVFFQTLAGVASTGTVGALRLHYPPLAPQKSRRNNGGL